MQILYIVLIINIFLCPLLKEENGTKIEECLTILQIKNEKLMPILDTILEHESYCDYYTQDLYFFIHDKIINDTIIEFQIGVYGSILIESGDDYYKGCFEYKGHWFFVTGEELNETVFIKTDQKKVFVFHKPGEITSDGKVILRVIEDDTYSFWIYHYCNNVFLLKEMYDTYCKAQTPIMYK